MNLAYFTKTPCCKTTDGLIELARKIDVDALDLCVRPGYVVEPANSARKLRGVVQTLRDAGLAVPMVSAPTGMADSGDPDARQLIAAAGDAGVGLVKLGYFRPIHRDYRRQVDDARKHLSTFADLGGRSGVRILYHTHCNCLGYGAAALLQLIDGLDPSHLGAYLDTCHSWLAGEPWDAAMDMLEPRLAAVALKDVTMKMEGKGRTAAQVLVPPAPQGMVDWDMVFLELRERRFDGPLSVQAEFEYIKPEEAFLDAVAQQIQFLRFKTISDASLHRHTCESSTGRSR